MSEVNYIIAREQAVSISAQDADKLIARRDGTAALLFLYLLRRGGSFSLEGAAEKLGIAATEVRRAADCLQSMGLLEISAIPAPAEELPEYTTAEMSSRTMDSDEFRSIINEVQQLLGKVLTGTELKLLFGIYDYLSLPPEVIMMLVSYCIERTERKNGAGRRPTMRSIEREAYVWANKEIMTLEMAEAHLKHLERRESELSKVTAALGIRGRELSSTERKYVESWIALGFGADTLAIAYDRTVMKTGTLQWKYMNSIVSSWHEKNLHTPEEIRDGDRMPLTGRNGNAQKGASVPAAANLERMEKLLDKMKKE